MSHSILDTIVASVRGRLPARKREAPLRLLEDRRLYARESISLASALRRDHLSIIAEIKRASPSAGIIRQDLDPVALATAYTEAGADAISIVTEQDHFLGSIEFLEMARSQTDLPLLRKDFVVDPYQIVEAKAFGADAVLLIASILSSEQIRELQDAAESLSLSALIEIHDERDLERIDLDRTRILGVNNRDLATFDVDILRAPRILAGIPDGILKVAESGLRTGDDLAAVRHLGIDAVLIGETLMRSAMPGEELRKLRDEAEVLLAVNRTER